MMQSRATLLQPAAQRVVARQRLHKLQLRIAQV
jgi:hypothetical protein